MKKDNTFLSKFPEDEVTLIKKYLPLRNIRNENEDIIIYEPLVKDILEVGNGTIDEHTFLDKNINIPENEINYLPVNTYKRLVGDVLNFTEDNTDEPVEDNSQEDDVKKK